MRPFKVLAFAAAPSLLMLGSTLAACEDSNGGTSSGTFEVDAAPFEASAPTDGATRPPDDAADGAVPTDAPVEAGVGVTVKVADLAGAKANVRVVFQDASGAVLGQAMTDATGKATSTSLPAMVTVLVATSATIANPVTFFGVTDGDQLQVTSVPVPAGTELGKVSATFTPNAVSAKAGFFDIYFGGTNAGCHNFGGSATATVLTPVFDYCVHPQNTILATATTADSTTVGFALMKAATAPAGGNVVTVGPYAFIAAGSRTLTATNLPTGDVSREASAWGISGPDLFFLQSTGDITTPAGLDFQAPVGLVDAYQTAIGTSQFGSGGASNTRILRRETAAAAATGALTSTDFATALPVVTGATASTTSSVARPDITIGTSPAPTAKGAMARLSWSGGTWTFVIPGNTTAFKVPALPADAAAFVPSGTVVMDYAGYVDGPLLPSYAALKALPVSPQLVLPAVLDEQRPLPADGILKISTWNVVAD